VETVEFVGTLAFADEARLERGLAAFFARAARALAAWNATR